MAESFTRTSSATTGVMIVATTTIDATTTTGAMIAAGTTGTGAGRTSAAATARAPIACPMADSSLSCRTADESIIDRWKRERKGLIRDEENHRSHDVPDAARRSRAADDGANAAQPVRRARHAISP